MKNDNEITAKIELRDSLNQCYGEKIVTGNQNYQAIINEIVKQEGSGREHLIPILQHLQKKCNYLPEEALKEVSAVTGITPAEIAGVASFYKGFRHRESGKHKIKVCIGTACHIKGAEEIYEAYKSHLSIPEEQDTDENLLFTVEKVACLGCCMIAPAVQIDNVIYGFVDKSEVSHTIDNFLLQLSENGSGKEKEKKQSPPGTTSGPAFHMCLCSSCQAAGSALIYQKINQTITKYNLDVSLETVGCTGASFHAPYLDIAQEEGGFIRYANITPEAAEAIVLQHSTIKGLFRMQADKVKKAFCSLVTGESPPKPEDFKIDTKSGPDSPFYGKQIPLVTEHAGTLPPLDIKKYRDKEGFKALEACLTGMSREKIISTVADSGLRGRGGGGFATAGKWQIVSESEASPKYLICNADEGDPGAFMDRMIVESFPFKVIEGMIIAAYAVGAEKGFIYIREEYGLAVKTSREAIKICRESSLLGKNILGTDFSFSIDVVVGAGAFVCGEETALIASIEGRRGMPKFRPPYPGEAGLYEKPTLVNNVETYSLVPWIIRNGPRAFCEYGTASSKGTKVFSLAGKIKRGGLIEVPMGLSIEEIVFQVGGGIQDGKQFKAVQIGGPSGGCIPAELASLSIDYERLIKHDAMMGSGGLVVLDESDCMVDISRYFMSFTQAESCGKCTFCRIGTRKMMEILDRLCCGKGKEQDIDELEHLAGIIKKGSLCGLGKSAPNPVLSTLHHYRDEYMAHIEGRCPAGKCKDLITFSISESCIGCTICAAACPSDAIVGPAFTQHRIVQDKCVKCGACKESCPENAVVVE